MPAPDNQRRVVIELTSVPVRKDSFVVMKGTIVESDKADSIGKSLTCKGICQELCLGAHYELQGVAKFDERYQEWQLAFKSWKINQTATATGLQNYLSRECKHIGDGRADQIVKLYGERAWQVLLNDPLRLARDIVGLNIVTANEIQIWAQEEQKLSGVKRDLYQAGLTPGLIQKLLTSYSETTPEVLRERAFSITEIKGIGFKTADRLALQFGMPWTHPERIKAGIVYTLQETMEDEGHTCVAYHTLINAACRLLTIPKGPVIAILKEMLAAGELCTQETDVCSVSKYPDLFLFPPLRQGT